MARMVQNVAQPTDEPILERPGITHRETDFHGNAKWLALPPESTERSEKGDLGLVVIPGLESEPLSTPGMPFKNLRGGK